MFNIYDGPSFEDSNAFFDIKKSVIDDCTVGQGSCSRISRCTEGFRSCPMTKRRISVICRTRQSPGNSRTAFTIPPAFHSANLYFRNSVDIRHFVIEPLFVQGGKFAFQSDDDRVKTNYCTFALNNPEGVGGSFGNFSAIDRQTILNDDDGSLTGLKNTISVNEDPFFNAPTETLECQSEETARTSPYDYVTTVVYPGCVEKGDCGGHCRIDGKSCAIDDNCAKIANKDNSCNLEGAFWGGDCGSSFCYGVPLYRQFLTKMKQATNRARKSA